MKHHRRYILPLLIAALALGFAQTTFAAATPAGTVITNVASVSYTVSGLPKTETSTSTDFTVDSKIDLTVANTHVAALSVLPATGAAEPQSPMKFIITNTGNEILDITLTLEQQVGGTPVFGETDTVNLSAYSIFVDNGADTTTYNSVDDTSTVITDLPYDDGGSTYNTVVWVIPNFADSAANNDVAIIHLIGTVTGYNAANIAPSTTALPGEDAKDAVKNDAAGTASVDGAGDAKHSDAGVFKATVGAVATTKSITTAPTFYIPGATVGYTLSLTNSWGVNATSVVITDDIDDKMALVCGKGVGTAFEETSASPDDFTISYDIDGDGSYGDPCTGTDPAITSFQIDIAGGIDAGETKSFVFRTVIE